MTSTTVRRLNAWPTTGHVDKAIDLLDAAADALDELNILVSGLTDRHDPLEPLAGAPLPTLADVGAISMLCEHLGDEIENLTRYRDRFGELRNAAAYLTRLRDDEPAARDDQ